MDIRCLFYQVSIWLALIFGNAYALPCNEPLEINIFSLNNGKGLETSRIILKKALEALGHVVYQKELNSQVLCEDLPVDINIFFEILNPDWFSYAELNWFIPNPECYVQELNLLENVDLILCRTHEVERIFKPLQKIFYLGFTSLDCQNLAVEKDYASFLHVAGGSPFKGTDSLIETWHSNSSFPLLKMVMHLPSFKDTPLPNIQYIRKRLPVEELRYLQNACGIHLCLSEAEGFGHYLMEAMSTGAVIVSTNAPPMYEFISDKRCLVNYDHCVPWFLGDRYYFNQEHLQQTICHLRQLSNKELKQIGAKNRLRYEQMTAEFYANLQKLLQETIKNRKKLDIIRQAKNIYETNFSTLLLIQKLPSYRLNFLLSRANCSV